MEAPSSSPWMSRTARSYLWAVQLGLFPSSSSSPSTYSPLDNDRNGDEQLERIIQSLRERYQALVRQHPFPDQVSKDPASGTFSQAHEKLQNLDLRDSHFPDLDTKSSDATESYPARQHEDLDPLTALVLEQEKKNDRIQELDRKYRMERARRKRGLDVAGRVIVEEEDYDEGPVNLQIIDKDLQRLPHPGGTQRERLTSSLSTLSSVSSDSATLPPHELQATAESNHPTEGPDQMARKRMLRRMLFVFAAQHPEPGYRQGMHEIASFVLYAVQLDHQYHSFEEVDEKGEVNDNVQSATKMALAADAYALTEAILLSMKQSYDVASEREPKPLEAMSRRILSQTAQLDHAMYQTLASLPVPPQLIFTKWIRLLFSREVSSTAQVLELWDAILANVPYISSREPSTGQPFSPLQACCEAACVARLLLHKRSILAFAQHQAHDNECLHWLMNCPAEKNVRPWIAFLDAVVRGTSLPLPADPEPPRPMLVPAMGSVAKVDDPLSSSTNAHSFQPLTPSTATGAPSRMPPPSSGIKQAFSSVKETLASKTQSISKRLYQEWENLAVSASTGPGTGLAQDDNRASLWSERNYDDPPPRPAPTMSGDDYNAIYRDSPGLRNGVIRQTSWASTSPSREGDHPALVSSSELDSWGARMELHLATVQSFFMAAEKNSKLTGRPDPQVPPSVWEALADLKLVQGEISSRAHGIR